VKWPVGAYPGGHRGAACADGGVAGDVAQCGDPGVRDTAGQGRLRGTGEARGVGGSVAAAADGCGGPAAQ